MDRGPMKFTSDVPLPEDGKTTMQGKQIIAGQLTELKTHRNAKNNNATDNCIKRTLHKVNKAVNVWRCKQWWKYGPGSHEFH